MASSKGRAMVGAVKLDGFDKNYVCLRECSVRNLSLLGFNESTIAKKNRVSIERVCWPVLDRKQDLQFRKISIDFLRSLTIQNQDDIRLPHNFTSLFLSPYGRKFYSFLVHLTNYALTVKINRMMGSNIHHLSMPKEPKTKEEFDSVSKLFKTSANMHLENYLRKEDEKLVMYQTHKKEMSDQQKIDGELRTKIEEKKKSIHLKEESLAKHKLNLSSNNDQLEDVVAALKTEVIEFWKTVDNVCDRSKDQIESLSYFMGSYDKYILDGSKLSTAVPPPLVDVDSEGLDVNGNVRLEHIVLTFNKALNVYISKLQKDFGCKKSDLESVCEHRDRHNELLIPLLSIQSKLVPLAVALNSSSEGLFREAVSQLNCICVGLETLPPSPSSPKTNFCGRTADVLPLTPGFE